jgi:uncharacterized cupredoxin-like copper-binding protein
MHRMSQTGIALLLAIVVSSPVWPRKSHAQAGETISVRLSSFAFSPKELRLRVDVPVRLHLENASGGGHNFSAPAFFAISAFPSGSPPPDGKVELAAGGSADLTLVPRAPGTYRFECTHFLHSLFGMTGTITVAGR